MTTTLPTFYLSHGGGPWPYMTGEYRQRHARMEASLQSLPGTLPAMPTRLLVISAHWEAPAFTVTAAVEPEMVYDFSGFPPETSAARYPAPGCPALAAKVLSLLQQASLPASLSPDRGIDHGTYVPLAVAFPQADIPVVQLSMRQGYDPDEHLRLGRALRPLRDEGVLIIGSGSSYHDLSSFFHPQQAREASARFDQWLTETVIAPPPQRLERLQRWSAAPAARQAHPREDHLIPLMVAAGAAGADAGQRVYHEATFFGGLSMSAFCFG